MHYLLYCLLLLCHRVFPVVAAVLASALGPFDLGKGAVGGDGLEQSKCGKELVIWVFEFIEKFVAGRVEVSNIEAGQVLGREVCVVGGGGITLVLTFVLLSTHLIIIQTGAIYQLIYIEELVFHSNYFSSKGIISAINKIHFMCLDIQWHVQTVNGIMQCLQSYQRLKRVANEAVNHNFCIICMINIDMLYKVLKRKILHSYIKPILYLINCCMDDNAKKKLALAKKLIQQNKYQQALEDLQIMVYKYSKLFQVHLMTALCYTKLGKDNQAEKQYLEVLDLKNDEPNAIRQLCDLYTKRGDVVKSAHYLQSSAAILKKGDPKKYREMVIKLIQLYEKDDNLQKIDPIFQQYINEEDTIGQDFVRIAQADFRIGVKNQCFNLQKWQRMGMKGQQIRAISPAARQGMNVLIVDVSNYLRSVALQYQLTQKQLADSLVQLRYFFPEAASILMLLFFDQYCVGQLNYSQLLLSEILRLLQAYFDRIDNGYLNLEYTEHQAFAVCILLSYEYLSFFREFFTLDDLLLPYMSRLATLSERLQSQAQIREDYRKKIRNFILKQCRQLNAQSRFGAVQSRLQDLKSRILKLQGSFLEQVIAKIALNCVCNYQKISDLKNMLKIRIKNLKQGQIAPHLYKYYYEYLIRIARVYKSLDQEIPLGDVLKIITTNDIKDRKYHLQLIWFEFCMAIRKGNEGQQAIAKQCLAKICNQLQNIQKQLTSTSIRRKMILKVFLGDYEIEDDVRQLLEADRSFQNLQCAGFHYFYKGRCNEALLILKQAFRLNQLHYHTNRLLFLCLLKNSSEKQAITFLERIKQGFPAVFWINYLLATNCINSGKYQEGQQLLSTALESFESGVGGFRYYYEKVRNIGIFSIQSLIQQNDYSLFFEQIVFPEDYIYEHCQLISTKYFQNNVAQNRVMLYRKEGQLLKILGRTKSALNYLVDGYLAAGTLTISAQSDIRILLEVCLLKKQYATLLFYMRQFKQSEVILDESQELSKLLSIKNLQNTLSATFIQKLDNEIKALAFQISVQRLSVMMKFQSFQTIDQYLINFKKKIVVPSKPSLNFMKNKYQFHILEYMHERKSSSELQASISSFLGFFGLDLKQRCSVQFQNTLLGLKQQDRRSVRECIEDYYIVLYLRRDGINQEEVLHMLQIFPRSSALLILFGMISSDLQRKTAAFLKCIQMQRESSISIDILASLYLKQKNYLPAAKLFLKSLQVDLLNVKCYLGLAICLFCLICRAVETKSNEQIAIIQKALVRINSYMEYLKLQDPSQNYHLLAFLRLLLNSESSNDFQVKFVLQSAQNSFFRHKKSLFGQLLLEATSNWSNLNIWKNQHQLNVVEEYLKKLPFYSKTNVNDLGKQLLRNDNDKIKDLCKNSNQMGKELLAKHVLRSMNQIGISINLYLKQGRFDRDFYRLVIQSVNQCEALIKRQSLNTEGLTLLKRKIKGQLYDLLFLTDYNKSQVKKLQFQVLADIRYYQYLTKYNNKIPKVQREIAHSLLLDPANQQIRTIYKGWMVGIRGQHLRKAKLSYKLQILNNNNESTDYAEICYKKLTILYRDDSAFLLYIQSCWNNQARREQRNLSTWLRQLEYLTNKQSIKQKQALIQKATRLKIEMAAFYHCKFGSVSNKVKLSKQQTQKFDKLVVVNKLMNGQTVWKQLKSAFKGQLDDFDWWILLSLISWLVQSYHLGPNFQKILEQLSSLTDCSRKKGFLLLVKIINLLSRSAETQNQLVDQIVALTNIGPTLEGKISPNSQVIIQCSKALLAGSWEQIQMQLSAAAQKCRIVSYSDRILINFFQVLKLYRTVESNPNEEGAAQSFAYMVDSMLAMVQDTKLRGFFLSLKGIIHTLTTLQQTKDRNLKMAMLLDPSASHSLLGIKR